MMGSVATKAAAEARRISDAAYREEKRAIALEKERAKIEAARMKLEAKLNRYGTKADKHSTANEVALIRAQTEASTLVAPIAGQSQVDAIDAEARARFVRAIPWIIGGVVVIGGIVYLRKRSGRAS